MDMTAKFSSAAPGAKARCRQPRIRRVETLVMLATLAWFAAALTAAIGELHGSPSAPAARAEASRDIASRVQSGSRTIQASVCPCALTPCPTIVCPSSEMAVAWVSFQPTTSIW